MRAAPMWEEKGLGEGAVVTDRSNIAVNMDAQGRPLPPVAPFLDRQLRLR